jgi:hypothetical protein
LWRANGDLEIFLNVSTAITVLITDGISQTDGTPAANIIKSLGNPLITIGIHSRINLVHLEDLASVGDDGIRNFFHITSYEVLERIGRYINCK